MSDGTTYDARVYRTEVYKGREVTTYKVRWKVGGRLWKEGFRTAALADSFRSALLTAARRGEVFSLGCPQHRSCIGTYRGDNRPQGARSGNGPIGWEKAAASTARRHRIILANAMDYAVELGLLETNPIRVVKWTAPKVSAQVDRRSVVNPRQARALLEAVRSQQPSGPRLITFFAVMYYAGLRPEEAINLAVDKVVLP